MEPTRARSSFPGPGASTFVAGLAAGLLLGLVIVEVWPTSDEPDIEHYREVRDFVRESFVREVSDRELVDAALRGMLSSLDDYSRYYDRAESKDLERETGGLYTGVGIIFRRPLTEGQVLFPLAGSPAELAGVRVGDTFLDVDGHPVTGLSEGEFREQLLAPGDGVLDVTLRGLDGAVRQVSIRPDSLVDPTVRHARIIDDERKIGYISILSFSRQTPAEFEQSFRFLEERGMRALVLDLRRNFGGVLDSAEIIAERFIPPGEVIVSIEGRGQPEVRRASKSDVSLEGFPLVVLVDGDSASASEVLAGALQDHRAAVVTGTPTYGKGMVQKIRRFRSTRTRAKVTSAYYYSPSHRNFERTADEEKEVGILPDVSIPISAEEQYAIHTFLSRYSPPVAAIPAIETWERAEGTRLLERHPGDPQLDAALELLSGRRPGPHAAREGV